jgi:hypothetical protein
MGGRHAGNFDALETRMGMATSVFAFLLGALGVFSIISRGDRNSHHARLQDLE